MRRRLLLAACLLAVAGDATIARAQSTDEMLRDFAEDFRHDPMAISCFFGIKVGDDAWWSVRVERHEAAPAEDGGQRAFPVHEVTLRRGEPGEPTWYFEIADSTVLRRIYDGTLSAGTAYARSFSTERAALNATTMDGYTSDFRDLALAYHLISHFWTRGIPEITTFERDESMPVHGAGMVSLYSMKDKRVTWFSIAPEETVNQQQELETGQTPNLFIFTRGRGRAKFGNREIEVHAGMSVFIAPFVKHVIWNPNDEPLEGILLLYGDNSAFTHGTSYMDFLEDLYRYYGDYDYAR